MANINLCVNPSFETNLNGWTFYNATALRDVTEARAGDGYSCKMTATTAGANMSAMYALTGLVVGQQYTVSFYVKTQPVNTSFSVVPSVDGKYTSSKVIGLTPYYQRRIMGFKADNTYATLRVQSEQPNVIGDVFWFDKVMINQGTLLPYFDGSFPYSSWSGTAHASTSTCTAFDATIAGNITTDEVVVVNGLCLNTLGWNVITKTGRYNTAATRGDDIVLPGVNGKLFVPNKPIDSVDWTLSMIILGANSDGTVPNFQGQRAVLEHNFQQILRQCWNNQSPVPIYAWQPNGTVRTTLATLAASTPDVALTMGGRRAELSLVFEVLPGLWSDFISTTVTGTPSAAWSNQSLSLTSLAGGTAVIDDAVITVTGPIVNPTISNTVTGTSVSLAASIPAGQSWIVDCGSWSSTLNAVNVLSSVSHSGHPRFVLIDAGDMFASPALKLVGTGTSAATNLSVTARRKHRYA